MKGSAIHVQQTRDEASLQPHGDVGARSGIRGFLPFSLSQPVAGGVFNWLESMWHCSGRTDTLHVMIEWVIYPCDW